MSMLVALLAQTVATPAVPAVRPTPIVPAVRPTPVPPVDVSTLPVLQLARSDPATIDSTFIRDELNAGRCQLPAAPRLPAQPLRLDLAVFVSEQGKVRRLLPRAIGCPTVEQYASGLVSRRLRGKIVPPRAPGWYQTSISFRWPQ